MASSRANFFSHKLSYESFVQKLATCQSQIHCGIPRCSMALKSGGGGGGGRNVLLPFLHSCEFFSLSPITKGKGFKTVNGTAKLSFDTLWVIMFVCCVFDCYVQYIIYLLKRYLTALSLFEGGRKPPKKTRKLASFGAEIWNRYLLSMAERSKTSVCDRSLAGIAGSNPTGGMDVCIFECFVLSCRGLCNEPIPRLEEPYRLWCVILCDLETWMMRQPWPALGCCTRKKNWSVKQWY